MPKIRTLRLKPLAQRNKAAAQRRAKKYDLLIQSDAELDRVRAISDETLFRVFQL